MVLHTHGATHIIVSTTLPSTRCTNSQRKEIEEIKSFGTKKRMGVEIIYITALYSNNIPNINLDELSPSDHTHAEVEITFGHQSISVHIAQTTAHSSA